MSSPGSISIMKSKTIFQGQQVWKLQSGSSSALIAPQYGALLLTWEVDGQPIIYWPQDADWLRVAHARGGNPILFPFVARHMVDGVIGKWQDASGVVRDLPMHGFARDMAFEVVEDGDDKALRMRITHTPATLAMFPFEFSFEVVYRITKNALEVSLETTNTGPTPLPYYAGHHFYFNVPHEERRDWSLSLPCERWGWQNPDGSVRFAPATKTDYTVDDVTLIDRFNLDFTSDHINLEHTPDNRRIRVELTSGEALTPWYEVTTWTQDATADFFCIEPWLGLPNAIHHQHGLRMLVSGMTETAVCRLRVG